MEFICLNEEDIKNLVSMKEAIDVNRLAFQNAKRAKIPERLILPVQNEGVQGATLFKPALINDALGCKVISVRPKLAETGLPTVNGFLMLLDNSTGFLKCLLNATYFTALRTAAGSAVISDIFLEKDVSTLAVFGAGLQGMLHVDAMMTIRPSIKTLYLVNRNTETLSLKAKEVQKKYPSLEVVTVPMGEANQVSAALEKSQVICTCTNASSPLFPASSLQKISGSVHINAIGSYTPTMVELDTEIYSKGKGCVVVDSDEALSCGDLKDVAFKRWESSETTSANNNTSSESALAVTTDLLNFIFGEPDAPLSSEQVEKRRSQFLQSFRTKGERVSLFKSVGTAIQDIQTSDFIYQQAKKKNVGSISKI